MIVAGGTYYERCDVPEYDNLYGSALRGISSIQTISENTNRLETCIAEDEQDILESYSDTYGFNYETEDIPETISFNYLHALSEPSVEPEEGLEYDKEIGPIEGDSILRFSLAEGTAVVEGGQVVYDPQSGNPENFHENGSTAEKLALVLNENEAKLLTTKESQEDILNALTQGSESADVVVLKCGASGALVREDDSTYEIPVFSTERVWPIGSGDIFSAVFACYWMDHGKSAQDAARRASLATAYYCDTQILPIPSNPIEIPDFEPEEISTDINSEKLSIYLAGPFFDVDQLWFVEEVWRILTQWGASVFSPYHDVGLANENNEAEVAKRDLEAIEECDVVFALFGGGDSGTLFEVGYAHKAGKPVFIYDNNSDKRRHTMTRGSGCKVYSDLPSAIYNLFWYSQ